jgi:hypothetical protein
LLVGRAVKAAASGTARAAGAVREAAQEVVDTNPVQAAMIKVWLAQKAADVATSKSEDDDPETAATKARIRKGLHMVLREFETVE